MYTPCNEVLTGQYCFTI